jgi:hypothetical protein
MTNLDEEKTTLETPIQSASEAVPSQPLQQSQRKIRIGLGLTLAGFAILLLGARPSIYGLDRSPVIGFVQVAVFLFGIGIICIGAYITFQTLWQGKPMSILSQIGMRMVQTGFVIAVFSGMADVFGLGSHRLPKPFFGPLQSTGVQIGEVVIGIGIFLMFPFHRFLIKRMNKSQKSTDEERDSEYQ